MYRKYWYTRTLFLATENCLWIHLVCYSCVYYHIYCAVRVLGIVSPSYVLYQLNTRLTKTESPFFYSTINAPCECPVGTFEVLEAALRPI